MKIVVAIPHSHTFFWTQTCVASLIRNPPVAEGCEVKVVLVDNSPWSPAIRGSRNTALGNLPGLHVITNPKSNKFHASALDTVIERFDFDLMMTLETDVLALRPTWLQWFVDQMRETDFAVGMWHHEQFVNPSCTLYRGDVLRRMAVWCKMHPSPNTLRWGSLFGKASPLDSSLTPGVLNDPRDLEAAMMGFKAWVAGPFAEKRGWPAGTVLKERPSGQLKGAGWYEPGQQLHHWAVEEGWNYVVCPTLTTRRSDDLPLQTLYGATTPDPGRQLEAVEMFGNAETAHLWGGTRALDIIKHPVTCEFVKKNTPMWLAREARFWREIVPPDVQTQTLELIRKFGWFYTGQGNDVEGGSQRDRDAAEFVRSCYKDGGVEW